MARSERQVLMLSRLMPNWAIVGQTRRRMLAATFTSTVLYGAEAWGRAMEVKRNRRLLEAVQRRVALRVCRGYRTLSVEAAQVLASLVPVDLLVRERRGRKANAVERAGEDRGRTVDLWCERWATNSCQTAGWTRRLIGDLRGWYDRAHGEVTFAMTQVLSGHGCFAHYLHRLSISSTPECIYGDSSDDTAEHTVMSCIRWKAERRELVRMLGVDELTAENVVQIMLRGEEEWKAVSSYFEIIISTKAKEARNQT